MPDQTDVKFIRRDIDSGRRILVTSDIHGHPELLKRLYEKGNVIALLGNVDLWRIEMINELSEDSAEEFYNYLENIRSRRSLSHHALRR